MKVKVATWGNSSAVRLPKAIMEELGLKPGQELDISVEAGEARLKPVVTVPRYTLAELVAEMKRLGPENEPPTAEWGILPSEWPDYDGPGPDEWEDTATGSR